jgi:hypothetical protein
MKNPNSLQIIKTASSLTENEQNIVRARLKALLEKDGIISMCLDDENLYVEYNPNRHSVGSLKFRLKEAGFPMEPVIKQAS